MSSDAACRPTCRRRGAFWAAAGVAMIGLAACSGAYDREADLPDVSLAGLSFAEAGLFEQGFTVQLRLKNPNDFDIPVDALNFALDINGGTFARGLTNEDFILPALEEVIVPIEVSVSTNDLIERVTAIGTGRRLEYELTGSAEIASWLANQVVPFKRSGKLALPEIPGMLDQGPPAS